MYSRGLRTLPWGDPLLRMTGEDEMLQIVTDRDLFVKSSTHLHRDELSPSSDSLSVRVCGMIV